MANIKEQVKNCGIIFHGMIQSVDEYVSKKDPANPKSFWSVTMNVFGALPVKIDLPATFDRSKLVPMDIIQLHCTTEEKFKMLNFVAVSI